MHDRSNRHQSIISDRHRRAVFGVVLIAAIYIAARYYSWTGHGSTVRFIPELLYPAMAAITLWGLWRLARRSGS